MVCGIPGKISSPAYHTRREGQPAKAFGLCRLDPHADILMGGLGPLALAHPQDIRTGWYLQGAFSPLQDTSPCSSRKEWACGMAFGHPTGTPFLRR